MVDKTAGFDNRLDVTLKLEEQNRNQLTFGAGVSQFEGFFGQLSFQTANFLGRGESLTVSLQGGPAGAELHGRLHRAVPLRPQHHGGVNVFKQEVRYISQFTQKSHGRLADLRIPDRPRLHADVHELQLRAGPRHRAERGVPGSGAASPQPVPARLAAPRRWRRAGHQQDHAEHRSQHRRSADLPDLRQAALGRRSIWRASAATRTSTSRWSRASDIWRQNGRFSLASRGQVEFINPIGGTLQLPIFEKLFLGGEYSVRGFDIRSIGPTDPLTGLVLGGNKSLLFNLEQNINIAGPVRLILFFDAGQVRRQGEALRLDSGRAACRSSAAADAAAVRSVQHDRPAAIR